MISLRPPKIGYLRAAFRTASLLACGVSLLIVYHVQPIAAKAYNNLCASQGMTFGDGKSAEELGITMIVIAVPILFARSNPLVFINLCASLITVLGATSLISTAGNTPYECFTIMGIYEDRTSGLDGFDFWIVAVCLFLNVLLLVDLTIWAVRKAVASWAASPSR